MNLKEYIEKIKTIKLLFFNIYRSDLNEDLRKKIDLLAEDTSLLFKSYKDELKFLEDIDDSKNVRKISFNIKDKMWCSVCSQSGSVLQDGGVELTYSESPNFIICICPNCIKQMYKKIKENR